MSDDFPPEHWDKCAQEARSLAERIHFPEARKIMLEIAAGYECMAEAARRFRQYSATVIEGIGTASLNSGVKSTLP